MNFSEDFWNGQRAARPLGKLRFIRAKHSAIIPKLNCPASVSSTDRAHPKGRSHRIESAKIHCHDSSWPQERQDGKLSLLLWPGQTVWHF
jgi:hypothetical protein